MTEPKQIARTGVPAPPPAGLKLADIYYVIFRQKWLIGGFLAAAVIAGSIVYLVQQPLYVSEAKLLVRYVVDTKSIESGLGSVRSPGGGGSIINSEIEILTSFDLCKQVAERIGPQKVLGENGGSNINAAAAAIRSGLAADNPRDTTIIRIRFMHVDPEICPVVLSQLIDVYLKRHLLVHSVPIGYDNVLFEQANKLLSSIRDNEKKLRDLQLQAGVFSITEAKKDLSERMAAARHELFDAESLLAEYQSVLGTNVASAPREIDIGAPAEKITEYKFITSRLAAQRQRELELSADFPEENPQVKRIREQVAASEKRKNALEAEFPRLVGLYTPQSPAATDPRPPLEVKIRMLNAKLAHLRGEVATLDGFESSVADVQRKLKLDEQNYMHVAAGLEAARFDSDLAAVKTSNIQPVQAPSSATPNVSERLKPVGKTFGGVFFAGLALAFLIEMIIDSRVRRPSEFETKIHIPLFLSIPRLALNGHAKMLPFPTRALEAASSETGREVPELQQTWDSDHALRRYIDGLRDRVLIHFEGDPHKPKLIGVTSCGNHAGVTSIAAGLAGALSETGDGNVLLLNLNFEAEAVHPFYRGELNCDLTDALESDKRQSGMVLQNLYVATAGHSQDPASENLSKQLARVVPRLRVSDYDYIVFDLPPTSPTTMTARVAGMMDLVLLVVEAGKDTQEAVKEAGKLLARSKAPVSAVLNKVRNPVPRWLHNGV